jgi:hypothetical protein
MFFFDDSQPDKLTKGEYITLRARIHGFLSGMCLGMHHCKVLEILNLAKEEMTELYIEIDMVEKQSKQLKKKG